MVIGSEVQLKFGKTKLIYSGCMKSKKASCFFGVVYPCQMKGICSKLTQQPWCVAHSASTGRIIRGFPHWAFPRQRVTRVLQPPAHTWRKPLLFSPSCKAAMVLHSSPVCPKMCCLQEASRQVQHSSLRGCKSLSPHYYCRGRCGWWRADIAVLWVGCWRNLLFWARIWSSPDPAAWVS